MSALSPQEKESWKKKLLAFPNRWIFIALKKQNSPSATLNGIPGIADWILHGQVSTQLQKNLLSNGDLLWIPGKGVSANFLFVYLDGSFESKEVFKKLNGIELKEMVIAENTFPEDFLVKLKQNLKKEEITFTCLE
jgi:hypothetical protein